MDRELNDFDSGVGFNRRSGSLSGFSLCGSAIRGTRPRPEEAWKGPGDTGSPGGSKLVVF